LQIKITVFFLAENFFFIHNLSVLENTQMGALDTIFGESACGLTNGRTEIQANSLKDSGVINTVSD